MISSEFALGITAPKGWNTIPFWSLFRRVKETGFPDEELLSVYRDHGVVPKSSRDDNFNKESEDLSSYQRVLEGSLVTNKMKAWQGSIAVSRHQGIVSPAYYVYHPLSEEHDQFLHYLLRSQPYIALYQRISKGVRVNQWDLEHDALRTIPVILPDLATQKATADFLDRETARIDQLIEKKQRLVEVTKNRNLAALQEAVLGGAKVVRSDDQRWLNDLPAGWHMIPLKHLVSVIGGATPLKDREEFWEGEIPWVSPKDMKTDEIADVPDHVSNAAIAGSALSRVPSEAVLIVVRGMILARTVPVCRLLVDATINQDMKALVPNEKAVSGKYLQRMLQGFNSVLMSFVEEAAHGTKKLRSDQLFSMQFPVPPLAQQAQIVDRIEEEHKKSGSICHKTLVSIERLREYRAALITAAVTGQIDVITYGNQGATDGTLDRIEEEVGG
ncbi:restriction endonuclease subunit S [Leisingera sp. JC11]|uniref:restriction endonuclease subunit S n=1 Tax=Leisingera sp. JC11 TaxID=3042469 RepID=UPI0034523D9F